MSNLIFCLEMQFILDGARELQDVISQHALLPPPIIIQISSPERCVYAVMGGGSRMLCFHRKLKAMAKEVNLVCR